MVSFVLQWMFFYGWIAAINFQLHLDSKLNQIKILQLSTQRDFVPAEYGHGGVERRRNELSTTTKSHETSYY